MHIKCPSCGKDNELECGHLACSNCKTELSGKRYEARASIAAGILGAAVLVGAGHYALEKLNPEPTRLPLNVEYEIVHICINGQRNLIDENELLSATSLCVCATEKASWTTTITELKQEPALVGTRIRHALRECR
ncbi:MAG: hypothetical protein K0Q68_2158 [Moraxellaceae bacterium]|jgi:hypothetical protein|nr:hypothetical protein [Moraxellaceae bacterium]